MDEIMLSSNQLEYQRNKTYYLEHNRQYYWRNREQIKAKKKIYYQKNKVKALENKKIYYKLKAKPEAEALKVRVFSYYSKGEPKCNCCGEKILQFLTIDHINGGGRQHRLREMKGKGGTGIYRWLEVRGYPEGFQVLCYNCNCAKGHFGICPHKKAGE